MNPAGAVEMERLSTQSSAPRNMPRREAEPR